MTAERTLSRAAGIVGIGQTEYSRRSGRSELQLAVESITTALSDAGLTTADVDGIVKFTDDSSSEAELIRTLGIPRLRFHAQVGYGGQAGPALVGHAAAAIAGGYARVVVAFRSLNERSGNRFGRADNRLPIQDGRYEARGEGTGSGEFTAPFGLLVPVHGAALAAHRYIHQYDISEEAFASVALVQRRYAQQNPNAMMYGQAMTFEDYQNSRLIAYPLRLFDCCLESDGAAAVVIVGTEMFGDVKSPVVAEVLGASQSYIRGTEAPDGAYKQDVTAGPAYETADDLFGMAGLRPDDVDVAEFYEAFAHHVYAQLEGFGFCGPGEGPPFAQAGETELTGSLPTNTHGGHLSEAYIHGMNHVLEAVRQIRGTAANQVENANVAIVSANGWSSVLLGKR